MTWKDNVPHTKTTTQRATQPQSSSALIPARELPSFTLRGDVVDVRGWQVHANDGEVVGRVTSLVVDMRTKMVRYLGVLLTGATSRLDGIVLVPVGLATRPVDEHVVTVHGCSSSQLAAVPRVPKRPITRDDEVASLAAYGWSVPTEARGSALYDAPIFQHQGLVADTHAG